MASHYLHLKVLIVDRWGRDWNFGLLRLKPVWSLERWELYSVSQMPLSACLYPINAFSANKALIFLLTASESAINTNLEAAL